MIVLCRLVNNAETWTVSRELFKENIEYETTYILIYNTI